MSSYSSGIPTSFDPALLYSELEYLDDAPPSLSHSDEIDAIQQTAAEDRAQKNSAGVVIQHRAWNTLDAFRSEEEYTIGTTGLGIILQRS
jgi:chromosome transmission fidelity protein 18